MRKFARLPRVLFKGFDAPSSTVTLREPFVKPHRFFAASLLAVALAAPMQAAHAQFLGDYPNVNADLQGPGTRAPIDATWVTFTFPTVTNNTVGGSFWGYINFRLIAPWDGVEGSFSASSASSDFSFLYLQLYDDTGVAPGNCPGLGPTVPCYPLVQEVPFAGLGQQGVNFSFSNLAPGDYKIEFVGNGAGSNITANYHAVSSVPEPASMALALGGLGVIGWARRRRAAA